MIQLRLLLNRRGLCSVYLWSLLVWSPIKSIVSIQPDLTTTYFWFPIQMILPTHPILKFAFKPLSFVLVVALFASVSDAQDSQLKQALEITPKQVCDYERPNAAELKECKFVKTKEPAGFVVHHSSGRILREFIDTNKDGRLDRWSYFKNGQESYRDIDENYDGKTDQYRWFGESGSRWGLDQSQDGEIDSWKVISAEEVAFECFQAIKNRDQDRFNRLLLTPAEFSAMQLPNAVAKDIQGRWAKAKGGFLKMAQQQKAITSKSKWVYAGNGWPSMMSSKNLTVYNHGAGFFENQGGKGTEQLALGSLVKVGDVWRMIELPEIYDGKALATGGAFFPPRQFGGIAPPTENDKELAKLYDQLADLETKIPKAKGVEAERLEKQKADLYKRFVELNGKETKLQWVETLADSVSSAYQGDRFEGAIDYLNDYIQKETPKGTPALDYVKWRAIFAEYGWINTNGDRQQRERAQDKLVKQLRAFVQAFPRSRFAGDALIQLGVSAEVSDPDEPAKALEWYNVCRKNYSKTTFGKRATGAILRLSSFGKQFNFSGKTIKGGNYSLRNSSGKIVILHFWQTWCDDGMKELASLNEKYGDELDIVSCNIEAVVNQEGLDAKASTKKFSDYMRKNASNMDWIHLHAPGGVEYSPLAHQLGVATEPMIALIDKKGRLVETNIAFGALDREVELERRRKD